MKVRAWAFNIKLKIFIILYYIILYYIILYIFIIYYVWFLVLWKTVQNDQNTIINTIIIERGGRSIFKGLW